MSPLYPARREPERSESLIQTEGLDRLVTETRPAITSVAGLGSTASNERSDIAAWARWALRWALLGLLYAVTSSIVLQSFLTQWGQYIGQWFPDILTQRVPRPFVYRVAMPWLVRTLSAAVPDPVRERIVHVAGPSGRPMVDVAMSRYGWEDTHRVEFLVLNALLFATFVALTFVWRALCRKHARVSPLVADLWPALMLLFVPSTFTHGGYIYDAPELLLSALALWFFLDRRWIAYYALLPLAILNKESSILMASWFLIDAWKAPRRAVRTTGVHLVAHAAIGIPLIWLLRVAFADRPGFAAWYFFDRNVRFWASFRWLAHIEDAYATGIPLPASLNVVNLALIVGAWWLGKQVEPRVRAVFVASIVAVAPLFLLFGNQDEIRVFGLACAPLAIMAAHAVTRLYEPLRAQRGATDNMLPAP